MQPSYYLMCTAILGLFVGSFLNVVIYRLPIAGSILSPRSHCRECKKTLPFWANIPIISYWILKGNCFFCKRAISIRYPLIEGITAVISVLVVENFGLHPQSISALILSWGLIALTVIDIDHQLLPDSITLPLLWIGLLVSLFHLHVGTQDAIIGAAAGYLCFWSVAKLFKIIRKKDGMGEGDFKLLAALGAWLGWQALPAVILMASLLGLASSLGLILTKTYSHYRDHCIPFGPYLSLAGWVMLLWGHSIIKAYVNFLLH